MTPDTFDVVFQQLNESFVLMTSDGVILSINQSAVSAITANGVDRGHDDIRRRNLSEFVADPQTSLSSLLRSARRASGQTIGALRFCGSEEPARVYCQRIVTSPSDPCFLLMRIASRSDSLNQFATLNDKVNQLNGEISRRRTAERALRVERDVAVFGRDIGIALVQSADLEPAMSQCTDLMVDRLGAAFARIWLADENGETLRLVASSGIYTHTDGDHSQIAFGDYKIGRIAVQQQPHVTNQVVGDKEIHNQQWAQREAMVAFAGYPLIDDGATVGVMGIFAQQKLSETVVIAMASVANAIALRIRKQSIQDGLAKQTLALREADRRKDEFLAMLSHELRNPLAPVRSGLDLLAMEKTEYHDTITLMQTQVEHLVRLVDDLMDVSRIMRGKVQLRRRNVELSHLVGQAVATLADALQDRHLELVVPETPTYVVADPVRLKQVVENLVKNACKYSDEGSRIWVKLSQRESRVLIHVQDDGIGIDPELLPHLFDLFTQSPRTLDRSQGGLGIGLTLVKSLVELHGGSVTAMSEGLGKGSTFTIDLPFDENSVPASEPATESDPVVTELSCRPLRILAVDDNRSARTMLARLFEKMGPHQVTTAEDGPSAIEEFKKLDPDLVLLDIGLPGMDGYAVAKAFGQLRQDRSCLLVALTGYGRKEDRERSRASGFDVHLVKPPGVQQLRDLLRHPKLSGP
ncbi:MAG: response regulator [Pirellulaceae bacterium]|nr:response regulator [Pirellulaceae bacterium]